MNSLSCVDFAFCFFNLGGQGADSVSVVFWGLTAEGKLQRSNSTLWSHYFILKFKNEYINHYIYMTDAPCKVGWMLSLLIRPGFPRLVSNYQF